MSPQKTIVIVGATGNQGSSVAHTFLSLPSWHVRCITRNPSSSASQALSSLGAEIIEADLHSPTSLTTAFTNANAIFLNTDFWETYRGIESGSLVKKETDESKSSSLIAFETEVQAGKNAVDAAAKVPTLEKFVYSAIGSMKKGSKGKYPNCYHWEAKSSIVDYIQSSTDMAKKSSIIYLGAYTSNPLLSPRYDASTGEYKFISPLGKNIRMPIIDPQSSTGPFVRALIEDEEPGTKLFAYDSYLTVADVVELWKKASGQTAEFVEISTEMAHKQFGVPMEVLYAPDHITEFGYMAGVEGYIEPRQLKKGVQTKSFEEWLNGRDWEKVLGDLKIGGGMKV